VTRQNRTHKTHDEFIQSFVNQLLTHNSQKICADEGASSALIGQGLHHIVFSGLMTSDDLVFQSAAAAAAAAVADSVSVSAASVSVDTPLLMGDAAKRRVLDVVQHDALPLATAVRFLPSSSALQVAASRHLTSWSTSVIARPRGDVATTTTTVASMMTTATASMITTATTSMTRALQSVGAAPSLQSVGAAPSLPHVGAAPSLPHVLATQTQTQSQSQSQSQLQFQSQSQNATAHTTVMPANTKYVALKTRRSGAINYKSTFLCYVLCVMYVFEHCLIAALHLLFHAHTHLAVLRDLQTGSWVFGSLHFSLALKSNTHLTTRLRFMRNTTATWQQSGRRRRKRRLTSQSESSML
jgi:hypothetical protein